MLNEESRVALTNYAIVKLGEAIARRAEEDCAIRARVFPPEITLADHKATVDMMVTNIAHRLGI